MSWSNTNETLAAANAYGTTNHLFLAHLMVGWFSSKSQCLTLLLWCEVKCLCRVEYEEVEPVPLLLFSWLLYIFIGMQVLEWNGVPLTGKTYEEVQGLVGQLCNEAEVCVRL